MLATGWRGMAGQASMTHGDNWKAKRKGIRVPDRQFAGESPNEKGCWLRNGHKMPSVTSNNRASRNGPARTNLRGREEVMQWLRGRVERLPFRLRSGEAPDMPLGTRVLVLKGEARNDAGQMAIVSGVAGSQVEISYRGPTGRIKTRRKQRGSLILMEEGTELIVDDEGCPRIRRCPGSEDETSEEGLRAVSSEDESRAQ